VQPDRFGPSSIARFGKPARKRDTAIVRAIDETRRFFFEMRWIGFENWLRARLRRKTMLSHVQK
jgi:hypothetical protein